MPRRFHCRLEPSVRGGSDALVYIYARAAAGLAGVLHGVQARPDFACACRLSNTPKLVAPPQIASLAERAQVEHSHPKSRAGRAGSLSGVGSSTGGSAECHYRALDMVGALAAMDLSFIR